METSASGERPASLNIYVKSSHRAYCLDRCIRSLKANVVGYDRIVVLDDGISVDREQLRKEHDQLMKLLTEDPQEAMRTGLLRKSDYCLTCKSGLKATCTAPFAGETGKVWCASQCSYKCRGTCGVAANAC